MRIGGNRGRQYADEGVPGNLSTVEHGGDELNEIHAILVPEG